METVTDVECSVAERGKPHGPSVLMRTATMLPLCSMQSYTPETKHPPQLCNACCFRDEVPPIAAGS